jgi:hypothetical protein
MCSWANFRYVVKTLFKLGCESICLSNGCEIKGLPEKATRLSSESSAFKTKWYNKQNCREPESSMSIEYLQQPNLPTVEEILSSPTMYMPFFDPSVTDKRYDEVFGLLYRSDYGDRLFAQDLRYAEYFGYESRRLMAYEYGPDAQPLLHNFTTFANVRNAISVEEARGTHWLTPYEKDIALFGGGTHDLPEGIVGDRPRGSKTPEFRAWEESVRWKMLLSVFGKELPFDFLVRAHNVIGHKEDSVVHDYVELGHTLTQFSAGMRVSRICFMLKEYESFHLGPWGEVENNDERKQRMCDMAVKVTRNTAKDLEHFAQKGYWIAADTLAGHAQKLVRIQDELGLLAAP